MSIAKWRVGLACAAIGLAGVSAVRADCSVRSGPRTAALIELYTSEGCSSCPPADRQLTDLRAALDGDAEVVPLALHVDYWDYIGWKDPFAQARFAERQRWLVHLNQHRTSYTPHFFVSGLELFGWTTGLGAEVRRVNARAPQADLQLQARATADGALAVQARASLREPVPGAVMYLALTESALVSQVVRGENRGATLKHDHVVRQWLGPYALTPGATLLAQPQLALPTGWNRARLGLVAFVQEPRSGRILQALSASGCAAAT